MKAPFDLRLDQTAFNRWLLKQERKYEWKDGRIVQMNDATRGHASIVSNILYELRSRLDRAQWRVVASDFGVEDETFTRFPDVLVEPLSGDMKSRRSDGAIILFEVLSPSSVDTDLVEKPEEYMSFDSLEAYVVASQDAAICWVWQRDQTTRAFPAKPLKLVGREQSIAFQARGITLPLAEIYRNIPTSDD